MIERKAGKIVYMCDVCGGELATGEDDFRQALAALKRHGWHSGLIDGAWHYTCTRCGLPGERATLARTTRLAGGRV
jgi:hypothetical protein